MSEIQHELQSYQDEEGEKVLELRRELNSVRNRLEEAEERQELAERQSARANQV
jgi:hypothetical protein